jgi:peptide/nickel transport system substrate-binding protein
MNKKMNFYVGVIFLLSNFYTFSYANADDKCLKVVAHEWMGEKAVADPARQFAMDETMRTFTTNEGLMRVDNSFNPQPLLAESWESNGDATEWTFNLRKGVKFHDGTDFDAEDVVWTYKRILDPDTLSGSKAILEVFLKDIVAVDSHTVKFIAENPTVEMPLMLKTKHTGIVPSGSTHESLQANPIGTGPYQLVNFKPGNSSDMFIRNDNYWDKSKSLAECMELIPILDPAARVAALTSGQVDLIPVIDPASGFGLKFDSSVKLDIASGGTVMTMSMWKDTAPYDDIRVRQALKLVVDRQMLVDTAFFGFGEPGNDNPVAPSQSYAYRSDIKQQDCEKAKSLIAEAGYPDGLNIDLNTAEAFPGMVAGAEAYAQMAACGNININLIKHPSDTYWDVVWLKEPFLTSSWGFRPPGEAFGIAYISDAKYPETRFYNTEFDAYVKEASGTVDKTERENLYKKAQELLSEDGGVVVPGFLATVAAMGGQCTGYTAEANVVNFYVSDFRCEGKN